MKNGKQSGFTLAELLIALAILGVIATFSIPKVLQTQQDGRFKAIAKEAAGMLSGAYDAYRLEKTPPSFMAPADLTPYLNYVKFDTFGYQVDYKYNNLTRTCNAGNPCIHLHNGAVLYLNGSTFGGITPDDYITVILDPDGKVSSTPPSTTGPGKGLEFLLYYNGRLTTAANQDPPWFSWN